MNTEDRELSDKEVNQVLRPKKKYALMEKALPDSWPTPLEVMDIMDAVDARKRVVYLSGEPFTIRYDHGRFFVQKKETFAPCGWFSEDDFRMYRKG